MRCLSLFALLLISSVSLAAPPIPTKLSPETGEWYRWRIVVSCAAHPLLNKEFREQVAREIHSAVSPSVAGYAEVDVVDLATAKDKDALIKAFEEKSWPALGDAAFRELTNLKTHFVRIDYRNSQYKIETRQHDGHTGLVSPLLRVQETRANNQVGRIAGQMVFPDFGAIGTIIGGSEKDPNGVQVKLRGSDRGRTEDVVKPGDLFTISEITKTEDDRPRRKGEKAPVAKVVGTPREATFLKALTPSNAEGLFRASVITRFETGLRTTSSNLQGFRVMRLDSTMSQVKVKVLTEDGKPHPRATLITVMATDADYSIAPSSRDGFAYDARDGLFKSPRPLKSIACLVVGLSPTYSERFPTAILSDTTVTVRLKNDETQARKAELEKATFALRMKLGEATTSLTSLYSTLGNLVAKQQNRDALDRLREGLKVAEASEQILVNEIESVKKMPGASPGPNIADAENQLQMFRDWRDKLKEYEERLAAAAKLDPVRMEKELRAKDLAERIETLRKSGEIPEALELFDELYELVKQPDIKLQKEKLLKSWEPVDDKHRQAREYLLVAWPKVQSAEEFSKNASKLRDAAEVMMKKNDKLGVRKLYNAFNPAYTRLKSLIETLDTSNEDDKTKLEQINFARSELEPLELKVKDWLNANK